MDKMKYVNNNGQSVTLGVGNILIGNNDVRGYEWSYTTAYELITKFTRAQTKKSIPLLFYGSNCYTLANSVYEIFMYDVINATPGKLYIGDYYIEGYFYASTKDVMRKDLYKVTYTFVSDTGVWIEEILQKGRLSGSASEFLDYPIDYNYDYFAKGVDVIKNESVAPCNFILKLYGSGQEYINIIIGGNVYRIYTSLALNEFLVINSKEKTIIKTDAYGNTTNEFSNRDKGLNTFAKIPAGDNTVIFPDVEWDITLLQERSEPLWS